MAVKLNDEQRWLIAHDKLEELINTLQQGDTREEWELCSILMTCKGAMHLSKSLDRLRKVVAEFTSKELLLLNAGNN